MLLYRIIRQLKSVQWLKFSQCYNLQSLLRLALSIVFFGALIKGSFFVFTNSHIKLGDYVCLDLFLMIKKVDISVSKADCYERCFPLAISQSYQFWQNDWRTNYTREKGGKTSFQTWLSKILCCLTSSTIVIPLPI